MDSTDPADLLVARMSIVRWDSSTIHQDHYCSKNLMDTLIIMWLLWFSLLPLSSTGNRGSCTNFGTGMFSPWNSAHQHGQKVTPTCLPNGTPNQSVDRRCCTCFRRVSIQQPDPVKFNQFNPFMGEMELRWFLDKARNDFDVGNQFLATSNNAKDQTRRQQGRLVC